MSAGLSSAGLGPEQFSQLFAMIHSEVDAVKCKTAAFISKPVEASLDSITDDIDQLGDYFDNLHALLESLICDDNVAIEAAPVVATAPVAAPVVVEAPVVKKRAPRVKAVDGVAVAPKKVGRPRKVVVA